MSLQLRKKREIDKSGRLHNAEGYVNENMHLKILSKMHNVKGRVLLTVPIFHNSSLHVLTPHGSPIQDQDQPVLITQHTLSTIIFMMAILPILH